MSDWNKSYEITRRASFPVAIAPAGKDNVDPVNKIIAPHFTVVALQRQLHKPLEERNEAEGKITKAISSFNEKTDIDLFTKALREIIKDDDKLQAFTLESLMKRFSKTRSQNPLKLILAKLIIKSYDYAPKAFFDLLHNDDTDAKKLQDLVRYISKKVKLDANDFKMLLKSILRLVPEKIEHKSNIENITAELCLLTANTDKEALKGIVLKELKKESGTYLKNLRSSLPIKKRADTTILDRVSPLDLKTFKNTIENPLLRTHFLQKLINGFSINENDRTFTDKDSSDLVLKTYRQNFLSVKKYTELSRSLNCEPIENPFEEFPYLFFIKAFARTLTPADKKVFHQDLKDDLPRLIKGNWYTYSAAEGVIKVLNDEDSKQTKALVFSIVEDEKLFKKLVDDFKPFICNYLADHHEFINALIKEILNPESEHKLLDMVLDASDHQVTQAIIKLDTKDSAEGLQELVDRKYPIKALKKLLELGLGKKILSLRNNINVMDSICACFKAGDDLESMFIEYLFESKTDIGKLYHDVLTQESPFYQFLDYLSKKELKIPNFKPSSN